MKRLLKPFQWLYSIYAVLFFILTLFIVFPIALIASFLGAIKGGNFIYKLCGVWADVWLALIFIRQKNIYEQKPIKGQPYIYVANHISYLDAVLIVKTVREPIRPLGKVELARVPFFGFIYRNVIVTIDRSNAENRAKSVRQLKAMLLKGISVFFFPEGTFNTTGNPLKSFYDGAFRLALETGIPIKPVLFLDAYNRMHNSSLLSLNPGQSRAVFLPEIGVKGLTMNDMASLKQNVFEEMEKKLKEYGASWIKESA